jgi:hypothetical protein
MGVTLPASQAAPAAAYGFCAARHPRGPPPATRDRGDGGRRRDAAPWRIVGRRPGLPGRLPLEGLLEHV